MRPEIILAPKPELPDFDYYTAILDVLKRETKAVNEYRGGKEKAFNYLYGKVDNIQWGACWSLSPDKPLTLGHKIHARDLKRLIEYIIQEELNVDTTEDHAQ